MLEAIFGERARQGPQIGPRLPDSMQAVDLMTVSRSTVTRKRPVLRCTILDGINSLRGPDEPILPRVSFKAP